MYSTAIVVNNTVSHIWKLLREILNVLTTRKKFSMCGDRCYLALLCDHFSIYTSSESLYFISEMNIMLYINQASIKQDRAAFY